MEWQTPQAQTAPPYRASAQTAPAHKGTSTNSTSIQGHKHKQHQHTRAQAQTAPAYKGTSTDSTSIHGHKHKQHQHTRAQAQTAPAHKGTSTNSTSTQGHKLRDSTSTDSTSTQGHEHKGISIDSTSTQGHEHTWHQHACCLHRKRLSHSVWVPGCSGWGLPRVARLQHALCSAPCVEHLHRAGKVLRQQAHCACLKQGLQQALEVQAHTRQ